MINMPMSLLELYPAQMAIQGSNLDSWSVV